MAEPVYLASRMTPPGAAALAVLAFRGPCIGHWINGLFLRRPSGPLVTNRPLYGWFGTQIKDDVVLWISPTDEEAEVYCHGGPAMISALLADAENAGARILPWREFAAAQGASGFKTEAVAALAEAETETVAGFFLDQITALDEAVLAASEDPAVAHRALEWSNFGKRLATPPTAVLYGEPNVGKSSLLNALVGYSRAIVTEHAGTTRDVLRHRAALDGFPIDFVDGAGIRQTSEPLEEEGIERLYAVLTRAELRVWVVADQPPSAAFLDSVKEFPPPHLVVANKFDLHAERIDLPIDCMKTSALTGLGVSDLQRRLVALLFPRIPTIGQAVPFNDRQIRLFQALTEA